MNTRQSVSWALLGSLFLALAGALPAQRTWVVNGLGGRDFLDLPPAVAAANPGDTIVVEASGRLYTPTTISKGITLMQTVDGWRTRCDLDVVNVPIGETFVLSGWRGYYDLSIRDCAGDVHISRCASWQLGTTDYQELEIVNCHLVTLDLCRVDELRVTNSRVMATRCAFIGGLVDLSSLLFSPAIVMSNSDVTLSLPDCVMISPAGINAQIPAVVMTGGRLVVSGGGVLHGATSCCPPSTSPAIRSSGGTVIVDPEVQLNLSGGTTVTGTSTFLTREMPAIQVPFLTETIVVGTPGAAVFILASLPADPIPTPFGEFWLDRTPGYAMLLDSGTIDARGLHYYFHNWFDTMQPGMVTTWQGVVVDGTGIHLTTPAIAVNPLR